MEYVKPAKVFHPGKYLLDEIKANGWSWNGEFIRLSKIKSRKVREIINGDRDITPKIAKKISKVFGTSPDYWLGLQKAWDERSKS